MTPDSDDCDGLRGLARSIDQLFSDAEEEPTVEGAADAPAEPRPVESEDAPAADVEPPADDVPVDAFWQMDEIAWVDEADVTEADATEAKGTGADAAGAPELEGTEFDAEELDAPELDDAEVAASGLGGTEFDAEELDAPELDDAEVAASGLGGDEFDDADLDRVDYDGADFDSDFDDEAWAELLTDTPEAGERAGASAEFPEPDEAPADDSEWHEMGAWGLDLVGGGEREEDETADGDEATKEELRAGVAGDQPPPTVPDPEEAVAPAALFARAVDTLLAGSENPTRARTRIQHYAEGLVEEGAVDDVADGIERLAAAGGDAVDVAREVLSPPVALALAKRLGRFTGEDERRERIELAVRLGYDFAPALSNVLAETENKVARYALVDALVAMGVDGWDAVVEMVGDERWWVVRNAVLVLGRTGGEESVRFLTRTVEHDDPRVRRETVEALEEIGGVKARDRIQSRLDDEAPPVRAAAVRAVGTLEIESARERLRTMLEQESDEIVEVAVIDTLGRLGDAPSIARLEEKLEGSFFRKPTTEVRAAVYGAFGAIGSPRALELLHAASDEKDPVTRTLARRVLRDLEGGEVGDERP